ncbi:YndM family protein [Virgibacillus sp. C22-A2]|uniref:YndM family protein n=1 Tax=Virgibacillus tibetensis TaxID=3042313 RepID=A0ABU6KKZ7_9BACI|nr:YndM family protein [Virgibacillus sp. C22-A2]
MEHVKALAIKFIAFFVVVFSVFVIFSSATITSLFWISILLTGVSYVIGDLLILRRYGNLTATIADFPLAFIILWALGGLFIGAGFPLITASLFAAVFITACEPFIHAFIINSFANERKERPATNQLQTEYSEEIDVEPTDELDR